MHFLVCLIVIVVILDIVFSSEGVIFKFFHKNVCPGCVNGNKNTMISQCYVPICNCLNSNGSSIITIQRPTDMENRTSVNNKLPRFSTSKPSVYCVDADRVELKWNTSPGTFYSMEYYTNPRYKKFTNLTRCGHEIIKNLSPNRSYTIVLRSYIIANGEELLLGYSDIIRTKTRNPSTALEPVNNFSLIESTIINDKVEASVQWNNTNTLACSFQIVVFGEDIVLKTFAGPFSPHKTQLTGFNFNQEYSIGIMAFSEYSFHMESEKKWLNITMPSCFQLEKSDFCVPEEPENLTAEEYPQKYMKNEIHMYNIYIYWSRPRIVPQYYEVNLTNFDNGFNLSKIITGNTTNFTFTNIRLGYDYQISLTAFSKKGASKTAVIHRHTNGPYMYVNDNQSQFTLDLIIILLLCPIIIIGIVIMYIGNHYLTKRIKNKELHNYFKKKGEKVISTTSILTVSDQLTKPDKWELDSNKLNITSFLGKGEFGIVRKGRYNDGDGNSFEVAIKMLRDNATEEEKRQLLQEVEIMKSVPAHSHLVALIGCITRGNILLITEFCSKGNLQSYLRNAWEKLSNVYMKRQIYSIETNEFANKVYEFSDGNFDRIPHAKDLISFARQITVGMEYLSSLKLIHRDLAARNILVYDENTVKISDFGLSRDVYYDNVYYKMTGGKLPLRWMALESMTHQIYTTQSDVWSFGVLLWEIVTMGSTPYPGISTQQLLSLLKQGYRMEKPTNCNEKLYAIMLRCWNACPSERPTFTDLKRSFESFLEEDSHYLNLDLKDPTIYTQLNKQD